jgi:hypothetical protein
MYSARLTQQEREIKRLSRICKAYLVELIGYHNFAKEHYYHKSLLSIFYSIF